MDNEWDIDWDDPENRHLTKWSQDGLVGVRMPLLARLEVAVRLLVMVFHVLVARRWTSGEVRHG